MEGGADMADLALLERLRQALAASAPGLSVMPADETPPEGLWRSLPGGLAVFCDPEEPGGEAQLALAAALASALCRNGTAADPWTRRLLGGMTPEEAEREPLPAAPRCVLLLQPTAAGPARMRREAVPLQRADVLCDLGQGEMALIKTLMSGDSLTDVTEYAQALQETALEELAVSLRIGIGDVCETAEALAEGYRQAREAIRIGSRFDPTATIFVWNRLVPERILHELPPERSRLYRALLFNRQSERILTEEMLATAAAFLRTNLNLSDTARQLHIHRNTLVYRLDRLAQATGLDLRRFDDAVTFRLLLTLGEDNDDETQWRIKP